MTITSDGVIASSGDEVTLYISVDGGDSLDESPVGGTVTATLQKNAFSTSSTYSVGDVVIYNGALYRCKVNVAEAGDWTNTTNWNPMNLVAAS